MLVRGDMRVPVGRLGLLAAAIGLGWAAAPFLARRTDRLAPRTRLLLAIGAGATLSLASAFSPSWAILLALRGLGALCAGTAAPAMTTLLHALARPGRLGRDVGIVMSAPRLLGGILAPVLVTAVAERYGWRASLGTSAVLMAGGGVMLALLVPGTSPGESEPARRRVRYVPGGARDVVLGTVAAIAVLAWMTVLAQNGPPVLTGWLTVSVADAGRLLAAFGVGSFVAAVAIPTLSDRIGRTRALMLACGLGGGAGLALGAIAASGALAVVGVAAGLLALSGIALGALPLAGAVLPAEAVADGDVGRSMMAPMVGGEILGGALVPFLVARFASQDGGAARGVAATAVLLLAVVVATPFLRRGGVGSRGRRKPSAAR